MTTPAITGITELLALQQNHFPSWVEKKRIGVGQEVGEYWCNGQNPVNPVTR